MLLILNFFEIILEAEIQEEYQYGSDIATTTVIEAIL